MISRFYSVIQHLSIDIVIGAVILLRFFCTQSRIEIDFPIYFLLASAVWLIYTTDHLRDAKQCKKPKRARYLFHERNETILRIAIGIIAFLSLFCVFLVPMMILLGGVILGALSLLYLSIHHKLAKWGLKEFYVALIYSLGILLAPYALTMKFDPTHFIFLFMATFLNLILFSWFEKEEDEKDGFSSIATQWKSESLKKLILVLISIGIAFAILNFSVISLYFLIVFITFSIMFLKKESLSRSGIYRVIGDGVFLIPAFFEFL